MRLYDYAPSKAPRNARSWNETVKVVEFTDLLQDNIRDNKCMDIPVSDRAMGEKLLARVLSLV